MNDIIKAKLAIEIHHSYKSKEYNFRDIPQFLIEETENILQWIKENTSEEARKIIIAVENDNNDLFEELIEYPESLKEETKAEELYTTIILEETIRIELFVFLLITRKDVKQFILSLIGDIKTTKVVPIAIMLIALLQHYEEASELIKDF